MFLHYFSKINVQIQNFQKYPPVGGRSCHRSKWRFVSKGGFLLSLRCKKLSYLSCSLLRICNLSLSLECLCWRNVSDAHYKILYLLRFVVCLCVCVGSRSLLPCICGYAILSSLRAWLCTLVQRSEHFPASKKRTLACICVSS